LVGDAVSGGEEVITNVVEAPVSARPTMLKTFLSYIPADSRFARMGPLSKFFLLVFYNTYPLLIDNPVYNLILGLIAFILVRVGGVHFATLKKYYALFLTLALFIFVSTVFFGRSVAGENPTIIYTFPVIGVHVYHEALVFGVMVYMRLVAMVCGMILWLAITSVPDLFTALEKLHISHHLRIFTSMAFRFISMVDADYNTIREAEKSRALDLDSMPLYMKPIHFGYYLIPLVTLTIKKALESALVLDSRAFHAKKFSIFKKKGERSFLMEYYYRHTKWDTLIILIMSLFFVYLIIGRYYFGWFYNPFYTEDLVKWFLEWPQRTINGYYTLINTIRGILNWFFSLLNLDFRV